MVIIEHAAESIEKYVYEDITQAIYSSISSSN
jgi:hypothetical protein